MRIERIGNHELPLPSRKTELTGGYDLRSVRDVVIGPGEVGKIRTGFAWEIDIEPPTFHGRRTSSLMPTVNVGLICEPDDAEESADLMVVTDVLRGDDRGEVAVRLKNTCQIPLTVHAGRRVAQLLVLVAYRWELEEVSSGTLTEGNRRKTDAEPSEK
jgi:dUTPase